MSETPDVSRWRWANSFGRAPLTRGELAYALSAVAITLALLFTARGKGPDGGSAAPISVDAVLRSFQGKDLAPIASAETPLSLPALPPAWVQALRSTMLWSAPSEGESVAQVGQWHYLRVLGAEGARVQVEVTDGASVTRGWVDIDQVGLSGPPTGRDAVVESRPPSGGQLPSPSFRAVPVNRPGIYRVQAGDSPTSIASAAGISPQELLWTNGLEATSRLAIGQVLQLPVPRDATVAPAEPPIKVRDISPGPISAEFAVVVDGDSGEVLWGRNADLPVAPASLTKIVTALVVLDHARPTDRVQVRVDSREMPESTVMGLLPSEELSVEDLLYGLMLPSGNDAALALAVHVSGTVEGFAALMNDKARALGLGGSRFVNPHGLDASGHLSTAYDMAMFAREGMRSSSIFRSVSSARNYQTPGGRGYQFGNLNQLLWVYPGADGVKIGYTDAAGRSIVGSATRGGHRVLVALMQSADHYGDSSTLLDWAFASYQWP